MKVKKNVKYCPKVENLNVKCTSGCIIRMYNIIDVDVKKNVK